MAIESPTFLRIITRDSQIVCINLNQLSSFEIKEKEQFMPKDGEAFEASVIRFFYHTTDKVLTFVVGHQITEQDFNYAVDALSGLVYQTPAERKQMAVDRERADIKAFEQSQ